MTIFTESFEEAIERDGAAETGAGFFVGAFLANAGEGLKEDEVGGVGAEDEDVVVLLVQFRRDGELGFGDGGVLEEALEFGGVVAGENDLFAEASEELGELFVVGLGELGQAVVGEHVAALLGDGLVRLDFDGNIPTAALGHGPGAVTFHDAPGEGGEDDGTTPAVADYDGLVAVELRGRMELGVLWVRLQIGGGNDLLKGAVDRNSRRLDVGGRLPLGPSNFMGTSFWGHT